MWFSPARRPFVFQFGAAALAFAIFGLWPPAVGQMLLVPVDGSSRSDVARIALAGGAAVLRSGRLPRSMVVSGNRSDIVAHLEGRRILVLASTGQSCGGAARG